MSNRRYIKSQRRPRPRKVWRGLLGCALGLGLSSTAKADDPALDTSNLTLDPLMIPPVATVFQPGIAFPLIGSTSDLKGDSDDILTQNDTTGTLTIHSLTFDSSKNPVTLTQVPGTVLTINGVSPNSFDAITKGGTFDSVITGGILATTQTAFTIEVDAGLLRIDSALTGAGKQLVVSGAGTLELTNTSTAHNFSGGIILNSGALRISDDLNLGAKSDASNFIDFRGGSLEIADKANVTLGDARFINVNRGGGTITTTGIGTLSLLGDDQLRGGTLAGLVKTGTGKLVLGGRNSFAGPLTLLQGTLELQNPQALGLDTHSALNLANSTLNFHSDASALNFGNDITLGDDASIDFGRIRSAEPGTFLVDRLTIPSLKTAPTLNLTNSSADGSVFRFEGAVQLGTSVSLNVAKGAVAALDGPIVGGSTGIVKSGTGTLIISGATDNRFSSPVLVTGGLLSLSKAKGFVAVPSDLLISGGQVRLDASDQISDASDITLSLGSFRLNGQSDSATSMTVNGGSFTTGAGGRLFLTLPTGAAVPASIPGGTVSVNAVPALVITGGATTINSGGEINATTVQVSGGVNTVQENGLFTIGSGGLTMAGIASPSINFTSSATTPGRLSLSGNVSYTGISGMASIASTGALAVAGVLDLNGAQRDFSINDDGTSAVDMLISTDITNGALKKSGLGTLQLTGNNTYSGGTTISAGLLEISGASALGTGPLTFNSGQINIHSDASVTTLTNLLNSTSADVVLDVDRDTPLGPTKGSVNFTGGLSIAANQLMVTGDNRSVSFTAPTTLLGTAKINAASTAVDVDFSAPIVQSGGTWGVTKDGIGKVIFDGLSANTYTGVTRVQNGTLELSKPAGVTSVPGALSIFAGTVRLTAPNQIADTSAVSVNGAGSSLDLNANNETIASLNGTGGNVTLGGATLTVTQGSYPGVISGNGMIVQENLLGGTSAILTLAGANTFTGGVTVNHGVVNFSQQAPGHTGTTLASGIWHVFNGSSLNFNAGSNITANNTEVILDGATSSFAKFDTLANNAGSFTISGGKSFTAKGALANSGNLTVGAGSALTVNGGFTNTGTATIAGSLFAASVMDTSGTLTISGPQTYAPGTALSVKGGVTSLNSDAGAPGNYKLSVAAAGGLVQFGSTQHLAGLTLTSSAALGAPLAAPLPDGPLPPPAPAAGSLVLTTQSLSTSGAGTLDLQNNALVVDYTGSTPFDSVKAAILLGFNSSGTPWAGHGITSSTAAASPTSYGVGYAEASGIFGAGGGTFDGQSVDGTAVLARFTKLGDATLDGAVDFNDLVKLAQNYNTSGTSWNSGDFTYDGTTDFNDLVKLAQNYNTALAAQAIPGAPAVFEADLARALAQVPEPSTLHLILAATLGIAGKRHRRRGTNNRGVRA
jgi:autotransporter-associated beta strand protein